jgi:hypothetical protein
MKALLRMELSKALKNKFFAVTVLAAIVISLLSALNRSSAYANLNNLIESSRMANGDLPKNPDLASDTLFNFWIGGEYTSLYYSLFFLTVPLIAAFPYGWSYFMERKNGYVKNVISRTEKRNYFLSKYAAVFISGGLAVLIPLLLNFLTVACFVPARMPDVYYDVYYGVPFTQMWSKLYFTQPFVYVFLYLLVDFLFGGLIAAISLALTFFVRNRVAVVLIPLFILLALNYANTFWEVWEISPINFLHASTVVHTVNGWIVLLEAGVLFACTFGITMWRGVKDDVY